MTVVWLALGACAEDGPPKVIPNADRPGPGVLSVAEAVMIPPGDVDADGVLVRMPLHNRLARPSTVGFEDVGSIDPGVTARFVGFQRCARDCASGLASSDTERSAAQAIDEDNEIELAPGDWAFLVLDVRVDEPARDAIAARGCGVTVRSIFLTDSHQSRHVTGPDGFVIAVGGAPPSPSCAD